MRVMFVLAVLLIGCTFYVIDAQQSPLEKEASQYKMPRFRWGAIFKPGTLWFVDKPRLNLVDMNRELLLAHRADEAERVRELLLTYQVNHQKRFTSALYEPYHEDVSEYVDTFMSAEKQELLADSIAHNGGEYCTVDEPVY